MAELVGIRNNEKAAIILAFPLLIIMGILIFMQVRYMRGKSYINFSCNQHGQYFWTSHKAYFVSIIFLVLVLILSIVLPVSILLKRMGSLDILIDVLDNSWGDLIYSFLLAFAGGLLMMILAFLVVYFVERCSSGKWKTVWEYLMQLPFGIPAILLGIALIALWNQPVTSWLYQTPVMIILGYVAHFIPFSIRPISSCLKQTSIHLEEAAELSTSNWFRIAGQITIPLIRRGLLTAFFIGFVLSFGDIGVTLLISPPGHSTIPIKIYNFMHYGAHDRVAALCLFLIGLQLLFAAGVLLFYRTLSKSCARGAER